MNTPETSALEFGPYRLAGPRGPLFRGKQQLKLKPKTLGVLWLLARQAGEVVTKAALLDALWPGTTVGEDALAFQIQALRQVLEDDAKQPSYIATVHRVGYTFIAPVTVAAGRADAKSQIEGSAPPLAGDEPRRAPAFVGREPQLARLRQHFDRALGGERQVVFVTGEAGIGKSALVDTLLAPVTEALIARGQCVQQHGAGEGYLPVLEALSRLCRQPRGEQVIEVLQNVAPSWLMQMPAIARSDATALQNRAAGAMLREIADAMEMLTAESALVLVLEDLHWSDPSTIEMLALLAQRRERARLLVIGTYRPTDVIVSEHPLKAMKQELVTRGQAAEIALGNLHPSDVQAYLARRFPDAGDERRLSAFVYRRTEGHPLFMVQVADYLAQEGAQNDIASGAQEAPEAVIPHGLRELIEVQLGRLTDAERQVLEIASVAGAEFAAASVSAGSRLPPEDVETCCEGLARHGQFIEARGLATWPDGTVSGCYAFRHTLYRDVIYDRLSTRRKARAHFDVGTREEAGYGERSTEIAAELAVHFERGRDFPRAVHHHTQAGEKALQRSANTEAIDHFREGLRLLETLPSTEERAEKELRLQVGLSIALTMTKGYSAAEVERVNVRAHELSRHAEETPEITAALFRIGRFHLVRGEIQIAREIGERLLRIARDAEDPALLSRAHTASAFELFSLGDFSTAQAHAEQSIALYDVDRYRALGAVSADDAVGVSHVVRAFALQILGYPEQALESLQKAIAAADELAIPFAVGGVLLSTADFHLLRRDGPAVRESADATIAFAAREGFPYYVARATVLRGWALVDQGETEEGIAEIRRGLGAFYAMGARLWIPCCLGLLAEAYGKAGEIDEARTVLAEALALVRSTEERQYEAELHRLEGELTRNERKTNALEHSADEEKSFQRAIDVARRQGAKLFELRATTSLARTKKESRRTLARIFGWFTEGLDTPDLREAKALLAELAGARSP